jgi:hypothetical protein
MTGAGIHNCVIVIIVCIEVGGCVSAGIISVIFRLIGA